MRVLNFASSAMSKQAAARPKKAPVPKKPVQKKESKRKGSDSDSDESEFDLDVVTARAADAFTKSVMKQMCVLRRADAILLTFSQRQNGGDASLRIHSS